MARSPQGFSQREPGHRDVPRLGNAPRGKLNDNRSSERQRRKEQEGAALQNDPGHSN